MATFVLVHGAWHGGWCYRDTARALRAHGHEVFTPTHTGVGEKAHLRAENITLETHIRDVCGCIEAEELSDVILCGHSYGGLVITGVADRMPGRIKALAYIDAYVGQHGLSAQGHLEKTIGVEAAANWIRAFRDSAQASAQAQMAPTPAASFNVLASKREWVDRRCTPQALATFETPLLLKGGADHVGKRLFILADGWAPNPFRFYATQLEGRPGWRVVTMPAGHDLMVDMPTELAGELERLV
jgi:pimeloyl-ACP methyl ester carboxylesterase